MEERISRSNVILVSHAMSEVARLCSVVVLLNDGQATLFRDVGEGIRAYEEMGAMPQQNRSRPRAGDGPKPPVPTGKRGPAGAGPGLLGGAPRQ